MKKIISIVMGILAGIEFAIVYITLTHVFYPNLEFTSAGRLPFLIILIVVIGLVKNYLYDEKSSQYSRNQIITIIGIPILLIASWIISTRFF